MKYLAQRALISYLRFVHKAGNKKVFNLSSIETDKFSESFGLQNAPIIKMKEEKEEEDNDEPKLSKI